MGKKRIRTGGAISQLLDATGKSESASNCDIIGRTTAKVNLNQVFKSTSTRSV
jgi:hypothetical protein